MRIPFPLFQSHLDLAHMYWARLVKPGDIVVDATCGNGHDTLALTELALSEDTGEIFAIDKQEMAIENTRNLLKKHLPENRFQRVHFLCESHEIFPASIVNNSVRLIVYNLGYLPGGDKAITTMSETTLKSLTAALELIQEGGALSITCYPGHKEGSIEEETIMDWASTLSPHMWSACHHHWLNRNLHPSFILIQKNCHV